MHLYVIGDIAFGLVGAFCVGTAFKARTFYYPKSDVPAPLWYGRVIFFLVGAGFLFTSVWDLVKGKGSVWH